MKKVYIVTNTETGECTAYTSSEKAYKAANLGNISDLKISKEEFDKYVEEVNNQEEEAETVLYASYTDGILNIHPELRKIEDDLRDAEDYYYNYDVFDVQIIDLIE